MPIGVIPKHHSTSSCLVTDHSAREFALNNFITKADSTIQLDNLQDFSTALHAIVARYGCSPAWLFKSDVSAAYHRIPVHPLWKIEQVLTFEGMRHVDRNLTFGLHSAPEIW